MIKAKKTAEIGSIEARRLDLTGPTRLNSSKDSVRLSDDNDADQG